MTTILVATDLTPQSVRLLQRAAVLSAKHGSAVTVLHVVESQPDTEAALHKVVDRQVRAELAEQVSGAGFPVSPSVRVETGVPHQCITRLARDLSVDLIIVGPGTVTTIAEHIFGSTADRVVRTAPAPVLVVRRGANDPYRRVVVAVDFSPMSEAALHAARLVTPEAERMLLHACEIPSQFEMAMTRAAVPSAAAERYRQSRLGQSRRELTEFAQRHGSREKTLVQIGGPANLLIAMSREGKADLIALGTQGRNALAQALLGSVARRVLAHAECDILIVNDDG